MNKTAVAVLSMFGLWSAVDRPTTAQQSAAEVRQSEPLSVRARNISDLRIWDGLVTESARSGALRLRSQIIDPMLPARTVERFEQLYQGVRIVGADIVRDSERGVPISIFGELAPELRLSITPTLSQEVVTAVMLRLGGAESVLIETPETVIVRTPNDGYRLAYTGAVGGASDVIRLFIDAHSGDLLESHTEVQRQQAAVGTGSGVLAGC